MIFIRRGSSTRPCNRKMILRFPQSLLAMSCQTRHALGGLALVAGGVCIGIGVASAGLPLVIVGGVCLLIGALCFVCQPQIDTGVLGPIPWRFKYTK
jgi:hypothetical protein